MFNVVYKLFNVFSLVVQLKMFLNLCNSIASKQEDIEKITSKKIINVNIIIVIIWYQIKK